MSGNPRSNDHRNHVRIMRADALKSPRMGNVDKRRLAACLWCNHTLVPVSCEICECCAGRVGLPHRPH